MCQSPASAEAVTGPLMSFIDNSVCKIMSETFLKHLDSILSPLAHKQHLSLLEQLWDRKHVNTSQMLKFVQMHVEPSGPKEICEFATKSTIHLFWRTSNLHFRLIERTCTLHFNPHLVDRAISWEASISWKISFYSTRSIIVEILTSRILQSEFLTPNEKTTQERTTKLNIFRGRTWATWQSSVGKPIDFRTHRNFCGFYW